MSSTKGVTLGAAPAAAGAIAFGVAATGVIIVGGLVIAGMEVLMLAADGGRALHDALQQQSGTVPNAVPEAAARPMRCFRLAPTEGDLATARGVLMRSSDVRLTGGGRIRVGDRSAAVAFGVEDRQTGEFAFSVVADRDGSLLFLAGDENGELLAWNAYLQTVGQTMLKALTPHRWQERAPRAGEVFRFERDDPATDRHEHIVGVWDAQQGLLRLDTGAQLGSRILDDRERPDLAVLESRYRLSRMAGRKAARLDYEPARHDIDPAPAAAHLATRPDVR